MCYDIFSVVMDGHPVDGLSLDNNNKAKSGSVQTKKETLDDQLSNEDLEVKKRVAGFPSGILLDVKDWPEKLRHLTMLPTIVPMSSITVHGRRKCVKVYLYDFQRPFPFTVTADGIVRSIFKRKFSKAAKLHY